MLCINSGPIGLSGGMMEGRDMPDELAAGLGRAAALEPLFSVDRRVLDRIAAATSPGRLSSPAGALREVVLTLLESVAGGARPAFRAGATPTHEAAKLTYALGELRLTLLLDPTTPGLPLGLPVAYRVLGRLTGCQGAQGSVVRATTSAAPALSELDAHGFFELQLPSGVSRLELALPQTRVVVPLLEVGMPPEA